MRGYSPYRFIQLRTHNPYVDEVIEYARYLAIYYLRNANKDNPTPFTLKEYFDKQRYWDPEYRETVLAFEVAKESVSKKTEPTQYIINTVTYDEPRSSSKPRQVQAITTPVEGTEST